MANFNKSFNFRNGVQVDNDNFIVNANGLVGIGTTIPRDYLLNVYGDARVTGLVTANNLYIVNSVTTGISTVGFLTASDINVSGVVTATSFSGSASGLTGIYAIAVDGWYVDAGFISTTSNVGIATTLPTGNFQVGTAVTINSDGNATYTGIITALSFDGNIDAANISLGTLSNDRLPSDINISGVVTASSFVGIGSDLTLLNADNISSGTLSNSRLPSDIDVAGIVTATGGFVGNVTGTASTAQSLVGSPDIVVGIATASNSLNVGTAGTGFSALSSGNIGVGTAIPTSEIQIRKASGSFLQVVSDSGQARISVGNSVGAGKSTGVIRFGNSAHNFDIINNDNEGDINFLLNGNGSAGTGKFSWQNAYNFSEAMRLNANGDFSVSGVTTLASSGGITTTGGDLYVGNDLYVDGTINGTITFPSVFDGNVNSISGISTFSNVETTSSLIVSIGASVGIGTDNPIVALDAKNQIALFGYVGVNTDSIYSGSIISAYGNAVINGGLGINTDYFDPGGATFQIHAPLTEFLNSSIKTNATVGFDTSDPKAIFDFSNVGAATTRPVMVVPNINNATITGIAQTPAGSIIFNTTTLKFQGYTGIAWTDFH